MNVLLLDDAKRQAFWSLVDFNSGCWPWMGRRYDGYGWFVLCGRHLAGAHRIAYMLARGDVPPGMVVHHVCGHKSCVRPEHLTCVTRSQHQRLHPRAVPTHCKWGHELTPDNVKVEVKRSGAVTRHCRACSDKGIWARRHPDKPERGAIPIQRRTTPVEREQIRRCYRAGVMSTSALAIAWGLSPRTIRRIVHG